MARSRAAVGNHHPFNLVLDFLHILAFEIYNISISDAPIHGSFARASEINGLFVEKERIKEYKSKQSMRYR